MLERILEPPWGIEGGQNGRSNAATLRTAASGDERPVTKESNIPSPKDISATRWRRSSDGSDCKGCIRLQSGSD
jgi:N-methylhydantoinase B/oxoprolinase/acetone carboxylase alpha subunit